MVHRCILRSDWLITSTICFVFLTSDLPCCAQTLVERLQTLPADVLSDAERHPARDMLRRQIRNRLQVANDRSSAAWHAIESREQWEQFVASRRAALANSLGSLLTQERPPLRIITTKTIRGDGWTIDNLVFNSREGLWITANLYRPELPPEKMPGIVICHSHHTPKTHGELQDMGMTWARWGCLVLVMDQFGHGERRTHPFATAADFPQEFRVSRQDYYFRYDNAVQLHLAGESLIGQFVWDLRRGVDLLLAQPGIDADKIALLGSVAGGGDPAAVAGMLDERFAAVVPFNFGGPQPETRYPLSDDAEKSFNYAGSGSWESTRNLRHSARDGFLPWVIVAGIAPRRLIFAHEFNWDQPRDPVWRRLEKVYQFFNAPDDLAYTTGRGELAGRPPESTHCTHIGAFHRRLIHQAFAEWFSISGATELEYSQRLDAAELLCLTDEVGDVMGRAPWRATLDSETRRAAADWRRTTAQQSPEQRRQHWQQLLGIIATPVNHVMHAQVDRDTESSLHATRVVLETEPGIHVPLLLLQKVQDNVAPTAVVVMIAQQGKQALLRGRTQEIARLLESGVAVCLPDVRGVGETRPDDGRQRQSSSTSLSSSEFMLGGTMVGARVHDVRCVLEYLRRREDIDANRLALWGDSLTETNNDNREPVVPHGIDDRPPQLEPLGGLAAMFAALLDGQVRAVLVRRGLTDFQSVLDSPQVLIPHDVVIPGLLPVGDLPALADDLSPTPLCLLDMVDGQNRPAPLVAIRTLYSDAPREGGAPHIVVGDEHHDAVAWIVQQLSGQ